MSALDRLKVFLEYDFKEDAKTGHFLTFNGENGTLIRLNWRNLSLKDKIWSPYDASLETIANVIQNILRDKTFVLCEKAQIKMEMQITYFRRKIKQHNQHLFQSKINFSNPFKKSLSVEVGYPHYVEVSDKIEIRKLQMEIHYSRFSPCRKIWRKIQQAIPASMAWKSEHKWVLTLEEAVNTEETIDNFIKKYSLTKLSLEFSGFNLARLISFVGKEFFQVGYDRGFEKGYHYRKDLGKATHPKINYQSMASVLLSEKQ